MTSNHGAGAAAELMAVLQVDNPSARRTARYRTSYITQTLPNKPWPKTPEPCCKRSSNPASPQTKPLTNNPSPPQAEKAAQTAGGGFSFFGGRTEKWENAADLYTQAANAFRMQKRGKEAGQAFERAASIQTSKLSEPDDAANSLTEAYKSYRKTDPEEAARVLKQAINHYTSKGNFRRAATNQQNLAEIYEVELGDSKRAAEAYEVAAGWFEGDNAEALANKLFLKVADLSAVEGDYQKSVENYEKVARSSVSNNLMKWSVKDYFLKAGICHLASGVCSLAPILCVRDRG